MPVKKLSFSPLEMMILQMLTQRDMYGYEMLEQLKNGTDGEFDIKAGTLYPVLHELEAEGFIVSHSKSIENGRLRKFYTVTEKGGARLRCVKNDWNSFCAAVKKMIDC